MRSLLFLFGLILLVGGALVIGQGLGYVNWPQGSFMINQQQWAYYGAGICVGGLFLMWLSRR